MSNRLPKDRLTDSGPLMLLAAASVGNIKNFFASALKGIQNINFMDKMGKKLLFIGQHMEVIRK